MILRQVLSYHRYYEVKLGKHSRGKDPAEVQCIAEDQFAFAGASD